MNATHPTQIRLPADLMNVLTLAGLLERLEHSFEPVSPDQYRAVVGRLTQALSEVKLAATLPGQVEVGQVLNAILAAHPDAAQVYENLNYQHAGLCLAPLDVSLRAELKAREAISRAAGPLTPAQPQA